MRTHLTVRLTWLLLVAAFACAADAALAADRVALVIGNGAYQKAPALPNPTRDAGDVADALGRLGFSVTRATNLNGADMRRALTVFGRASAGAEMAVIYYAGHGIEMGGENWLIPVDAELQRDIDTENEAVSLKAVTLQVAQTRQLGLVILDACRNNPFAAGMKRSSTTRATVARGFARVEPSDNVLVAFAAKDGTTASDGDGRNSPFTAALLRNLETPGLEINFLFRNVRDDVMAATRREQQPFVYGSLSGQSIYLKPGNAPLPSGSASPQLPPPALQTADEALWDLIKGSEVAASFEEFLKRYPSSARARDARARLETLKPGQQAALPPPLSATYVALLDDRADGRQPTFILTVDPTLRNSTVRKVKAAAVAGKSFELWLVHDGLQRPRSLGVIGASEVTSLPMLSSYDTDTIKTAVYAVSVEPFGGSRSGNPTGPVVYSGRLKETSSTPR